MTSNCKLTFLGDFSQGFTLTLTIERNNQSPETQQIGRLENNTKIIKDYQKWQESYSWLLNNNLDSRSGWEIDENIPSNVADNQIRNESEWVNISRQCWHHLKQEMRRWLKENSANLQKIESALNTEFSRFPHSSNLLILADDSQLWKLPWYEWQLLINHPLIGVSFGLANFNSIPFPTFNYNRSDQLQDYQSTTQGINTNLFSLTLWLDKASNLVVNLQEDLRIYFRRQKSVRILGILGDDTLANSHQTLNLSEDQKNIQKLKNAVVKFLDKPSLSEFVKHLAHNYDILSYSGHSGNELININQFEEIRIGDFNHHLQDSIRRGLKILIFNSCDGIPFGLQMLKLNSPFFCIVMQEAIPDETANLFLQQFLIKYSEGNSLSTSVRLAQQNLQGEAIPKTELAIPGVESLPTLIQIPSHTPPTYQELQTPPPRQSSAFNIKKLIAISLIVTMLVVGLRWFGKLQPMELKDYDNLIQQQVTIQPDSRLVVIRVTPEDSAWLNQCPNSLGAGARTLSDANIGKIINLLQSFQARVIGIDIFREGDIDKNAPVKCETNNLENANHPNNNVQQFRDEFTNSIKIANDDKGDNRNDVIVVCLGDTEDKLKGIYAPSQAHADNIGFADLVPDRDNIIRRQLLYMSLNNPHACKGRGKESFSLKLAQRYLADQGITRRDGDDDDFIQLGKAIFPPLQLHRGGYNLSQDKQQIEGGIQVMLNYRHIKDYRKDIASSFTLQQLFEDKVTAEDIKDKIVLVGVDQSSNDRHYTPFTTINQREKGISGVFIHAEMTSYILDIVAGKRSLIWSFPWWIDMLIIGFFSMIGGAIVFILSISRLSSQNIFSLLIAIGILNYLFISGISWVCFNLAGLWFPFFPSFLAIEMIIVGACIANYLSTNRI